MQQAAKSQSTAKRPEIPGPSNNSSFRDPGKADPRCAPASSNPHTIDGKQVLYITISSDASGPIQHARKVNTERPRNCEAILVPKFAKGKSALDCVEHLTSKALTSRLEFRRPQANNDKDIDVELTAPQPKDKQSSGRLRIRTFEDYADRQRDPRIVAKIRESVTTADETRLKQLLANFERVIAVHVACAALADEELMFGAMLEDADLQSLDDDDSGFSASPESRP